MYLKDEFEKFLESLRCLDWFKDAFNEDHGNSMSLDEYFKNTTPENYVADAFFWGKASKPPLISSDGLEEYWSLINDEWIAYYMQNELLFRKGYSE